MGSKLIIPMETIEILRTASIKVFEAVKDLAGTEDAAGDFGRGAGGDISRNIDITAENTAVSYTHLTLPTTPYV